MFSINIASGLGVRLRTVSEDRDMPLLFQVYACTRVDILTYDSWSQEEKHRFLEQQFLIQHKAYMTGYENPEFYILSRNDTDIGRLYLEQRTSEIRIIDIALLPEFRNSGVGTALLQDILNCADKQGKRVSIHVEKNNPALSLYNRLGFTKKEEIPFYDLMETQVSKKVHQRGDRCVTI